MPRKTGANKTLQDIITCYKQLEEPQGWTLHKYFGWVCIAMHSRTFEDPDIKIVIHDSLDYKLVVHGKCMEVPLPSLQRNNIQTIMNFATKTQRNICCGFDSVLQPDWFSVYYRRYMYDLFELTVSKPRYQTVYRSPYCLGVCAKGPCRRCMNMHTAVNKSKQDPLVSDKEDSKAVQLARLIKQTAESDSNLLEFGLKVLKENNF